MIDQSYLEKGLTALAHAGTKSVFSGHYGAAFLAAYFMNESHDLPSYVQEGLVRNCEQIEQSHSEFFQLFEQATASKDLVDKLVRSIDLNLAQLRSSGHGVILGVLALKALLERPELCTEKIVEGITLLVENAVDDRGDRYYGYDDYRIVESNDVFGIPEYHSIVDMVEVAFAECRFAAPDRKVGNRFYFFSGELEHGVTLAHAIVELDKLGYNSLVKKGLAIHRIQMHLNRQRPEEVLREVVVKPTYSSVFDESYWRQTFTDPHSIKVPYSALSLFKDLSEQKKREAEFNICKVLSNLS
ncbi:hypothetical protein LC040_16290 [Bacillus tianshenii]|nr:hypothetical protein LC040_16290 [Bacillus tianshenii]